MLLAFDPRWGKELNSYALTERKMDSGTACGAIRRGARIRDMAAEQKPAWLCEFAASAREVLARPFFTLGDFHVTTGFLLKADLFLGF
jgi:hypothetical protein